MTPPRMIELAEIIKQNIDEIKKHLQITEYEEKVLKKIISIIYSNKVSKYNEIVSELDEGWGELLIKYNVSDRIIWLLRQFNFNSPKEAIYIWQETFEYLTSYEIDKPKRLALASLYFYVAEAYYNCNKSNYGLFYLKAYVEDIAFHGSPEKGGAIQALISRCGIGKKGIQYIHDELFSLTNCKNLNDLKEFLKKLPRSEFERLCTQLNNRVSLEGNEEFFFSKACLLNLLNDIKKQNSNSKKWKKLEYFCQLFFGSIPKFQYKFNENSRSFQLDGHIKNNSKHDVLSELGKTIIVEAKHYSKRKINKNIILILSANMNKMNSNSSFLITSGELASTARDEIFNEYLQTGKYIICLETKDIKEILEKGIPFPVFILKKMTDIKMKRK